MGVVSGRGQPPGFTDHSEVKKNMISYKIPLNTWDVHGGVFYFVDLSPTYGAMHSCPHPLEQHFSLSGQSLSLEQNSAHRP